MDSTRSLQPRALILSAVLAASVATESTAQRPTEQFQESEVDADEFDFAGVRVPRLPSWLRISGSSRLRYEGLEGQFRADRRFASSDHLAFLRQTLKTEVDIDQLTLGVEGIDARVVGGGRRSVLGRSTTDTVDFLQAFVELRLFGPFDGRSRVRIGRQTQDIGSRRLFGRNRFRNTVQAASGVYWETLSEAHQFEAFWFLPTEIRPSDPEAVVGNEVEPDDEDRDFQFAGAYWTTVVDDRTELEFYGFALTDRRDGLRERELYTPGIRFHRSAEVRCFDFDFEGNLQFGHTQAVAAGPTLRHRAWALHSELGYTFDADWRPRLEIQFDAGSGDSSAGDGENNRFDPLFPIRFDFGPLGIFGPIGRVNTISPAFNLELRPTDATGLLFGWRGAFLTERSDVAGIGGVVDPSGSSGSEFGHQLEILARFEPIDETLRLEFGVAHLFAGEFLRSAPNARAEDSTFVYLQTVFTF